MEPIVLHCWCILELLCALRGKVNHGKRSCYKGIWCCLLHFIKVSLVLWHLINWFFLGAEHPVGVKEPEGWDIWQFGRVILYSVLSRMPLPLQLLTVLPISWMVGKMRIIIWSSERVIGLKAHRDHQYSSLSYTHFYLYFGGEFLYHHCTCFLFVTFPQ